MAVSTHYLSFSTGGNADIIDITDDVSDAISKSGLSGGTATIFVPGATGAVTTIEYESGLISDLTDMLERIAPQDIGVHIPRFGVEVKSLVQIVHGSRSLMSIKRRQLGSAQTEI